MTNLPYPATRGRRQFAGPSGWLLRWEEGSWVVANPLHPGVTAAASGQGYPVGTTSWTLTGTSSHTAALTLTPCTGQLRHGATIFGGILLIRFVFFVFGMKKDCCCGRV